MPDQAERTTEVEALARNLQGIFTRIIELVPHLPDELQIAVLRQQLKAIKEELGEARRGGGGARRAAAPLEKAGLPPEVEKVARRSSSTG